MLMLQYALHMHKLTIGGSSFWKGPQITTQQYTQCVTDIVISAKAIMAKIEWETVTNVWDRDINPWKEVLHKTILYCAKTNRREHTNV